jgi:hypothetical protein
LVPIKDSPQDHRTRKNKRLRSAHLGNIDDAELSLGKGVHKHVHQLAAPIVEHGHNRSHIRPGCNGFHFLFTLFKVKQLANIAERCRIFVLIDDVDQCLPSVLR